MKTKILFFLILFNFIQLKGILNLEHSPPANFQAELMLTIDQPEKIKQVFFYFRAMGDLNYKQLEKNQIKDNEIIFKIPSRAEFTDGIEYYFKVETKKGEIYSLPRLNANFNPFRLINSDHQKNSSSGFVLLSPDKNYKTTGELVIAVSYFTISEKIDPGSIKLVINDKVTAAEIGKNILVYQIESLAKTNYEFYVKATSQGRQIRSPVWKFKPQQYDLPWNLAGDAKLDMQLDSEKSDTTKAENELQTDLNLNLKAREDWWRARSYVFISSRETKNKQPVNRYYLKFGYPLGEITLGDYFANGNSFAAYGKYIRGFAYELHLDNFRFYSAYGQIQRSTNGSSYSDITDSLQYKAGTFQRKTIALRGEIGSQRSFCWGLEFVKNKDDIGSLAKKYYEQPDSSYSVTPKDNVVIATDARLALFQQKLVWNTELAMSLYNSDILGGAVSIDSLEADLEQDIDLPIDPQKWEDFFVINENIEPVIPGWSSLAFKTNLRAFFHRNLVNVSYSAVGSSFHSLATDYVQSDASIFSVNDNITFLENRMNLNLGFSTFSDNVYDHKISTTSSYNYYGQIYYRPQRLPDFRMGMNISDSQNEDAEVPYQNIYYDYQFSVIYPYNPWDAIVELNYNHSNSENEYSSSYQNYEAENKSELTRNKIALNMQRELMNSKLKLGVSFSANSNPAYINYADSSNVWQQIKEESSYNFCSFYIRNNWYKLAEKWQPYAKFRFSSYTGNVDTQNTFSLGTGTNYWLNAKTTVVWENRLYIYRNADDNGKNWHEYETGIKMKYRF
jgi:hypothetical protein